MKAFFEMKSLLEFPDFVERNTIVHERNSGTWEFGKGALSELRFCGVAVGKGKESRRPEV